MLNCPGQLVRVELPCHYGAAWHLLLYICLEILESDVVSHSCFVVGCKIWFRFADPEFFPDEGEPTEEKFVRLLQVDCEDFFKTGGRVDLRLDDQVESNLDQVEDAAKINDNRMVSVLKSGRIVLKEVNNSTESGLLVTKEVWSLACPEPLHEGDEVDGPDICYSHSQHIILVLRHFVSGRKVHAVSSSGEQLYSLGLESPQLGLEQRAGLLPMGTGGRFFCVVDQVGPTSLFFLTMTRSSWYFLIFLLMFKIILSLMLILQEKFVIVDLRTGRLLKTLVLAPHYGSCHSCLCGGFSSFFFAEDKIVILGSGKKQPLAADVFIFW